VESNHVDAPGIPADAETTISHFIPSVELTGSRGDKVRKLDTLIVYLQRLRGSLAQDTTGSLDSSRHRVVPGWGWFTAGVIVGAAFILFLLLLGAARGAL
jgi:hypothetical protein